MGMLSALKQDDSIDTEKDIVGGGFTPFQSAIYPMTVLLAYLQKSDKGALGLHLVLKNEDSREMRESIYLTSGTAKGGTNTYKDKKTGETHYLPGFLTGNSLAVLTVGKELAELETEEKVINLYNATARQEVPTKVDMVTELIGQPVYAAVQLQIVDKQVKGTDGQYVSTGETREDNEIMKFFRAADRMTVAELKAQATEAAFFATWEEKWKGETRNRASKPNSAPGAPTVAGAPAKAAAGAGKPASSLFSS